MAKLVPYLKSKDARAQAEFYTQALGGEILSVMTKGQAFKVDDATKDQVVHLSLVAGGFNLFMTELEESIRHGNGIALSLEFATEAEARAAFDNLAQGGKVTAPFEPAFWGAMYGEVNDKYGITWMITTEA